MSIFVSDSNARIEALIGEAPIYEWSVEPTGGQPLGKFASEADALQFHASLAVLASDTAAILRITKKRVTPDYLGTAVPTGAVTRFCEWALRQLGHVSVFAFDGCGDSSFLVVSETGKRAQGRTLAAALFELVSQTSVPLRKPLYVESAGAE